MKLTPGTHALLAELEREGSVYAGCGNGNVSRLKSLRKQGFAVHAYMGGPWRITDAGRAYLFDSKPAAMDGEGRNG